MNPTSKRLDHEFVAKVSYRSTAKFLKINARDEDEALEKAVKLREVYGCLKVEIIGQNH